MTHFYMVMAVGVTGEAVRANLQRALDLGIVFQVDVNNPDVAQMLAYTLKTISDQFVSEGLVETRCHPITGEEEMRYTRFAEQSLKAREN